MVSETSNQGADNTPKTMQRKFGHLLEVVVLPEQWGQHVTDIIERIRKS